MTPFREAQTNWKYLLIAFFVATLTATAILIYINHVMVDVASLYQFRRIEQLEKWAGEETGIEQ
ncbi:hypothetical protein AMJ50_00220 [Parcubacteria bacterium DG_74_3]|nr:MAG: hypothetical protein AMJ50_00220 [Parcubacteria bacterium DG_74_3]